RPVGDATRRRPVSSLGPAGLTAPSGFPDTPLGGGCTSDTRASQGDRMPGGTFTTTIQAPPEKVWAVVADIGTHASWSPKAYSMEWTSGEPNQVGSTFHSVGWIPGNKHNE